MNLLVLYRFYAKDTNSEKVSVFLHFIQRLLAFTCPIKFIFIADNTPDLVIDFCSSYGRTKGISDFTVIKTDPANRKRKDGTAASHFMLKHFTHFVTSMELVDEFATDDSTILFCEDDYLYHDTALAKAVAMVTKKKTDFVSLYDGPSHYGDHLSVKNLRRDRPPYDLELIREFDHHWRTGDSCCFTYIATKAALNLNRGLFFAPVDFGDCGLWKGMWMNGKSKLWTSVPALVYHLNSVNFETVYWDSLRADIFSRKNI